MPSYGNVGVSGASFHVFLTSNLGEDESSVSCSGRFNHGIYQIGWAGIAQSVQRLATGWTVRGSKTGGCEIFHTRPDRP
jgi:hypothetical protein